MSRSAILVSRLALLLVSAGALVAGIVITVRDRPGVAPAATYTCPMHAEVRAARPGACPICGMALERSGAGSPTSRRDLPGAADIAAVENVRRHNIVEFVRKRSLLLNERELRAPASVESDGTITALFYRDQIAALTPTERGTFSLANDPSITLSVRRLPDPPAGWDASTSRLRFRATGATAAVSPGQAGWLELAPRPRQVLTVPASAVLQSADGPYVLAWTGDFRFEKRPIEIGETFSKEGFAVVLSGVQPNERVVAKAAFFVDADRRAGDGGAAAP